MKRFSEWWLRRSLVKKSKARLIVISARLDELEALLTARRWGRQAKHGMEYRQAMTFDDPWSRTDHEFLKDSEKVEMDQLAEEHFILSQFLSDNGQGSNEFFRPKMHGGVLLGENSPKAYMSVKTDRSSKHTWDFDEDLGVEWRHINGKRQTGKRDWREVPKRAYYPEGFPEAANAFGRAKDNGDEELAQSILQEYKDKGYEVC